MRVWQLAFVLMIITSSSLQGEGVQQGGQLFVESDEDRRVIGLADEVRSKGWIIYSARIGKDDWDLFLMRPDGSDRKNITNTPGFNEAAARFSPDGQRILYYRMPKDAAVDNNKYGIYDLIIADADGRYFSSACRGASVRRHDRTHASKCSNRCWKDFHSYQSQPLWNVHRTRRWSRVQKYVG